MNIKNELDSIRHKIKQIQKFSLSLQISGSETLASNNLYVTGVNGIILSSSANSNLLVISGSGVGGGSGLTYFTESKSVAAPNATVPAISLTVNSSETNIDAVFAAKGTGATLAQIPDNTTTGGNKRGQYATDFQKIRLNANAVAAGNYSGIVSGYSNRATGESSFIGSGYGNSATAQYSSVIAGTANSVSAVGAIIGGGDSNLCQATNAFVGGGFQNNCAGSHAVLAGGSANISSGLYSAVGGGFTNRTSFQASVIAGGANNSANAANCTIGGGQGNTTTFQFGTIAGGQNNNSTAIYSTIGGGVSNAANGQYSTIVGGRNADCRSMYGRFSYSSGYFVGGGDAQMGMSVLRRQTTDSTANVVLSSDGGSPTTSNTLALPNNSSVAVRVQIVARQIGGSAGTVGDTAIWDAVVCGVKRAATAASTALVGAVGGGGVSTYADAGAAAWMVTLAANTTNGTIEVQVTGEASKTINWVATMHTTEIVSF